MTLASGLNSRLAEISGGSQARHEFLTFAINNIEDNFINSECEKPSDNKTFSSVSEKKTIRKDLKILVKRGEIEGHQQTVVLDGKRYSPMVYGSLDALLTDI